MTDPAPTPTALRLGVLAVSVLHDLDLEPANDGIVLTGSIPVGVSWAQCRQALAGSDPDCDDGRDRLSRWLFTRRWIADLTPAQLAERARPVGLPRQHTLHPGHDWVLDHVRGDALDLGLGIVGLKPGAADDVVVVSPDVWAAAGIDPAPWWPQACTYLTAMGRLAVDRWRRKPGAVQRPMGDCDVVTLLGSMNYRKALVLERGGMTGMAVPMRSRGWTDLCAVDPAFAITAAAATAPEERGFIRPLLVTSHEVVMVPDRRPPTEIVLRDATSDAALAT